HMLYSFNIRRHPRYTLFPYTTLFRSGDRTADCRRHCRDAIDPETTAAAAQRTTAAPPGSPLGPAVLLFSLFPALAPASPLPPARSEEHTSELQSRSDLVCRLLLEKKN